MGHWFGAFAQAGEDVPDEVQALEIKSETTLCSADFYIAKEQGKYKGRKPIDAPEFEQVTARWKSGAITAAEAMRTLHMTKTTFYRRAKMI